jgi:hypothetical protein
MFKHKKRLRITLSILNMILMSVFLIMISYINGYGKLTIDISFQFLLMFSFLALILNISIVCISFHKNINDFIKKHKKLTQVYVLTVSLLSILLFFLAGRTADIIIKRACLLGILFSIILTIVVVANLLSILINTIKVKMHYEMANISRAIFTLIVWLLALYLVTILYSHYLNQEFWDTMERVLKITINKNKDDFYNLIMYITGKSFEMIVFAQFIMYIKGSITESTKELNENINKNINKSDNLEI